MIHHEINKSGSSSYPPESTSTPCRPQTPSWKSHPEDSGNHIDYRLDGTVDLLVWPTPDKLYLPQALTVTGLCERPLGILSAKSSFLYHVLLIYKKMNSV